MDKNRIVQNLEVLLAVSIVFVSFAAADVFQYESHGHRDPFIPLIGQDKNSVGKLSEVTSVEDLRLEGIAVEANRTRTAIINGEMLKVGQKVGFIEVKSMTATMVVIVMGGKEYTLKLSEEGGPKSE